MASITALLVDGDILAYKAACKSQESVAWDDDAPPQILTDEPNAERLLDEELENLAAELKPKTLIVCLSDSRNWRKELWPEYKAHREKIERPALLGFCKEYLKAHYQTLVYPRLEADDVMGIEATKDPRAVMVSVDKDMQTVPGRLYNQNHPEDGVRRIAPVSAFRHHMLQTLTGDSSDGYKGARGIGPKKAEAIINSCETNPEEHFEEWRKELWLKVESAFLERKQTKEDALLNARMANILTVGRYVEESAKVRLWSPPR